MINAAFQSWTLLKSRGVSAQSGLLFLRWSGHLDEAVLVEPEEPPALLLREVLGTAALVELDRRLVVLRHHEHHAGAACLHRQLEEDGEEFRLVRSKEQPKSGCTLVCKHSHYWGAAGSLNRCPDLQKEEQFRHQWSCRAGVNVNRWRCFYLCTHPSHRTPPGRAACPPRGRTWSSTWRNPPPWDLQGETDHVRLLETRHLILEIMWIKYMPRLCRANKSRAEV